MSNELSNELLNEFKQAYQNLGLLPLLTEDQQKFLVIYNENLIEDLKLKLDLQLGNAKIIFCGHRGCGKSTLLSGLGNELTEKYFVVFFSIAESVEMSDINHVNILFNIGVNLLFQAEEKGVKFSQKTKENLYKWLAQKTKIEEYKASAEGGVGLNFFTSIMAKLKVDAIIRQEIKQEYERKISELVARINEIAALITKDTKKEVLVIIDDLDKLDLARVDDIYRDNIKALFSPSFSIIYTIPIAVMRDKVLRPILETESNNDNIIVMPVVKLFNKGESRQADSKPRSEAMDILRQIIYKRVAPGLIDSDTIDQLIIYSGGVLRELIRLANNCCFIAIRLLSRKDAPAKFTINQEILEEAANKLRNDFALPLGKKDYEILQKVYDNFKPDDPKQDEFLDLLHQLSVLEYRNRENWYDIHPLVVNLLENEG
jgi:energy-coupling factor transporter ATP-binding protein EcfA2